MNDDPIRYSDDDVRKIIQRALEIQKRATPVADDAQPNRSPEGLSIDEIEQTAAEIGLDPSLIRQAASDLHVTPDRPMLRRFLGAETQMTATRTLPQSAHTETLQELAVALQSVAGVQGMGSVHGGVCSYVTSGADAEKRGFSTEITVQATRSGTVIEIRERFGMLALGIYGGLMGGIGLGAGLGVGFGVGMGVLGSGGIAAAIAIGTFAASYGLARLIFTGLVRSRRREGRRMADRIAGFLSARLGDDPSSSVQD